MWRAEAIYVYFTQNFIVSLIQWKWFGALQNIVSYYFVICLCILLTGSQVIVLLLMVNFQLLKSLFPNVSIWQKFQRFDVFSGSVGIIWMLTGTSFPSPSMLF